MTFLPPDARSSASRSGWSPRLVWSYEAPVIHSSSGCSAAKRATASYSSSRLRMGPASISRSCCPNADMWQCTSLKPGTTVRPPALTRSRASSPEMSPSRPTIRPFQTPIADARGRSGFCVRMFAFSTMRSSCIAPVYGGRCSGRCSNPVGRRGNFAVSATDAAHPISLWRGQSRTRLFSVPTTPAAATSTPTTTMTPPKNGLRGISTKPRSMLPRQTASPASATARPAMMFCQARVCLCFEVSRLMANLLSPFSTSRLCTVAPPGVAGSAACNENHRVGMNPSGFRRFV